MKSESIALAKSWWRVIAFPDRKPSSLLWIALSALMFVGDWLSGPYIQFPIFYLIPVVLSAWFGSWRLAIVLAMVLSLGRLTLLTLHWDVPWSDAQSLLNTVIRILVLVGFALLGGLAGKQARELLREVHTLRGIIPICSYCKKIRKGSGDWQQLEMYISEHSEALFSHGICEECARKELGRYGSKDPQG